MTTKKADKLISKRKIVKAKTVNTKPQDKKKDSSLLIKAAETVGGLLGKVAGTAKNLSAKKKTAKPTPITDIVEEVIPKQLPAKTLAQLPAKSKPKSIKDKE